MRRGRQPLVAAVLALARAARCPDEPWLDCGAAPPPPPPPVAPPGGDLLPAAADPLLLPRTAATLDGHSATTDEALNAAGAAGNHTSHFVAFRCKHSMGYLQRSAHPVLGTKVDVTPYSDKELLPPREAIWRLAQAPGGLSVLEALDGHHLLTMHGRLRTPPWMLFVVPPAAGMDATSTPDDLTFRVELDERTLKDDRERRANGRLYAVGAGAYVNCVDGKHLRGHSGGANRRKAAAREPSTLLEIWTLSAAQARRAEAFREAYAPPPKKILQKPKSPLGLFSKPLAPRPARKKAAGSPTEEAPVGGAQGRCDGACAGEPRSTEGYYPAAVEAFAGFVCPSAFRDASDWVFAWPWQHFSEKAWVAPTKTAASCLPQIPVVYAHANRVPKTVDWAVRELKRPFVLVSGQSDFAASRYKQVLGQKLLHRWYAQNADVQHRKLRPIPIGLNCFEQAPEMKRALKNLPTKQKKVWVNFGNTHAKRRDAWRWFCGDLPKTSVAPKPWATCEIKKTKNNVRNNPHLVAYYGRVAAHRYVAAPRGNGLDTHRLWEALYLGCVPIVQAGPLDALYRRVGALVVRSWTQVTSHLLDSEYDRLVAIQRNASDLLTPGHWKRLIESDRRAAMDKSAKSSDRGRCWGLGAAPA